MSESDAKDNELENTSDQPDGGEKRPSEDDVDTADTIEVSDKSDQQEITSENAPEEDSKEALEEAPSRESNERILGFASHGWKVAGAVIRGPSHVKKDVVCQDAAAAGTKDQLLAAVICDGAGSRANSDEGAALVADYIVQALLELTPGKDVEREEEDWLEPQVLAVIEEARANLAEVAEARNVSISNFACTVVGLFQTGDLKISFHLGDGLLLGFAGDRSVTHVSYGTPSEYANEAYFLSDPSWRDHIMMQRLEGESDSFCLMTDGVSPFALEEGGPKLSFLHPILKYVEGHDSEKSGGAIRQLLTRDVAQEKVGDDKSFIAILPFTTEEQAEE